MSEKLVREIKEASESGIQKLREARRRKLEQFTAAFIAEVGSREASLFELVETWNNDTLQVSWRFQRRADLPALPPSGIKRT